MCTGTCLPVQLFSSTPLFYSVHTKHLWVRWEHKQKALRSKGIPQCRAHLQEQVAEHPPQSKRYSAAAEIIFVFNIFIVTPTGPLLPSLHLLHHSPSPSFLFLQSPLIIPFPTVPSTHPFHHSPLNASLSP